MLRKADEEGRDPYLAILADSNTAVTGMSYSSAQMLMSRVLKEALYRIWCGVNRLGDTSAFVITAGQLLLTRRGKTRMYTVGIVFEFYTVPL